MTRDIDEQRIVDLISHCDYKEGTNPRHCAWCGAFKLNSVHTAKQAIEQLIVEAYKKGYIDGGIATITTDNSPIDLSDTTFDKCTICGAQPMTTNCNNAGCDV